MNAFKFAPLAFVAALAVAAHAEPVQVKVPTAPPVGASTLTRAEVLADVHIWNLSGLAELHRRGRSSPDTETSEYLQAKARYDALRASPEFPALVEQMRQRPFSQVRAR